jgi:Protein of unknown function (DUF4012)
VFAALMLITVGLALIAGWGGAKYRHVRTCLDSSTVRLRTLEAAMAEGAAVPSAQALAEVGVQMAGLQSDIACLRREGQPFLGLAPWLRWLPGVGSDIAAVPDLLEMAQALVDGGVSALDALSPVLAAAQAADPAAPSGGLNLPNVVAALERAGPQLVSAEAALAHASTLRDKVGVSGLAPEGQASRLLALVDRTMPLLRSGVRAARIAPELLGSDGPRTYLILAQNDDERRPTGGWISGVGVLTVDRGQVTDVGFSDSFSVDNLAVPHERPPGLLLRTMWAEMWLLRDANWSPDFPTSAQVAERFLRSDQGVAVDGVIAVDQEALRLLVAAMEPLVLQSTTEPVTGANLQRVIRLAWAQPRPGLTSSENWSGWETHRKDVMMDLVAAMLDRMQAQSDGAVKPEGLAQAVWQGLQGRHILITLDDPEAAALLAAQRWDGALLPTEGDYLQVVDANVGFNKVDPNVQRAIDYQVDLRDPGQIQSTATVRYQNQSPPQAEPCVQKAEWLPTYEERMIGCYWDLVRFYAPEGARLLETEREPWPPGSLLARYQFVGGQSVGDAGPDSGPVEKGKIPFTLFFVVPPGETRDVRLEWQLPPGIITYGPDGIHYRLTVQKQSGTPAVPLRVTVHLLPGAQVVRATSGLATAQYQIEDGDLVFNLDLAVDRQIEVVFR